MPHHICFYDDRRVPTHCIALCLAIQTVGQKVAYLEYQQGQVVIGSASPGLESWGWGRRRDRVDMRIWFAY